jgi:KDO2-lipid IV(A) lauroyltransferase
VSKQRSALRNRVEFAAYRAARSAVVRLGPRGVARVGEVVGDLFLRIGSRRREILEFNVALAFPQMAMEQRRAFARQVSRHFGRVALDSLRLQRVAPDDFLRQVGIVGEEHIDAAADHGRGFLYLTAHLGLWEVAALAAGLIRPEKLLGVNRPLDNPLLEAEVVRFRRRFGNEPLGKRNIVRSILQHLKNGGSVGFLIDQRVDRSVGVEVPFFGQPTCTHPIVARVARKTGAPIVPACALWDGPGRYTVRCFEPVVVDDLPDAELEDIPFTAHLSAITERMIRQRPEQWLWFHDRWRELRLAQKGGTRHRAGG